MADSSVSVRSNIDAFLANVGRIQADVRDKATVRALNKIGQQAITATSKEIRSAGYGLKAADIKAQIKLNRATERKASVSVVASGRPVALIKYGARELGRGGVSVSVLNGRKVIAQAFIRNLPNGRQAVLIREPGAAHKKVTRNGKTVWSALPIRQLFGPSVPDAMSNGRVQDALERLVVDKFPGVFAAELRYAIGKA